MFRAPPISFMVRPSFCAKHIHFSSRRVSGLHQIRPDGISNQFRGGLHTEIPHYLVLVRLCGPCGDVQGASNFFHGAPLLLREAYSLLVAASLWPTPNSP